MVLPCVLAAVVCIFVLYFVLRLNRLDMHVPLIYWGDALYFDTWVKGLMEGNSSWNNVRLGMPVGADWRDFPVNMNVEATFVRIFGIFTSSPGLVLNLIWLLGTVAAAGFAAYCLQRLGINKWIAACLAIIYALQPFTFYRGVGHFNLLFYLVPLLATAAIEIAVGGVPCDRIHTAPRSLRARLISTFRAIPAYIYLACLAQGFSYIYNSFFSVVLFMVAALLALTVYRRRSALTAGFLAIAVTCSASLINLAPNLIYWAKHGTNPAMAYKAPIQAEIYGLKLRHLLTPIPGNPVAPIRYIQKKLEAAGFDDQTESATDEIGTIGGVGLLSLLAGAIASCLQVPRVNKQISAIWGACAALTLTCILLATVGGFGVFSTRSLYQISAATTELLFLLTFLQSLQSACF